MFPKFKINNRKQKGFAIISALFLIVVLSFLGVSMSRIFTSGQQAINQDISSLQAYFAGQSALQWGMYQAVLSDTGTITLDNNDNFSLSFSNAGLNNTSSQVVFLKNTILSRDYYNISAIGCYGYSNDCANGIATVAERSKRKLEVRFVP